LKDLPIDVVLSIKLHKLPESIEVMGDWDKWANGIKMTLFSSVEDTTWVYIAKFTVN
jgi:hypothetical protein